MGTNSISYTVHVKDMQMVTDCTHSSRKSRRKWPSSSTVLYTTNTPSAMTNGVLTQGTITATNLEGPLQGKQITDLIDMINSGGAYANVHTTANPMGEIRGQIVGKTGTAATGGQNTANQGISQSNSASTAQQCAAGALTGPSCNSTTNQGNSNTGSNTAGQTAGGGTGTAATGGQNTANQGITQSNSATGGSANQGNANTGSNTAGQTAGGGTGTGASTHYEAKLTGKNEVPPHETKATGTATFNAMGTNSISYTVHVKDMQMVTTAHIHQGKAGENGPVVAAVLYTTNTPSAMTNGVLTPRNYYSTNLEGPLQGKQITDLIDMINSGGAYANVHTTANPMGEIRGQIVGKTGTAATGGQNTANQGISQSNSASTAQQCAAGALTGPSCNSTTNQGNSNTGSNTAGQTAGGGTGTAATGGQNTANQGISQSILHQLLNNVLLELLWVHLVTAPQTKAIQIQEVTLLVK